MKILIVGGDTEALAASFVLSSVAGNDVTVMSPFADPSEAPYVNGPLRQHGDGPELRAALEYFELEFSEFSFRKSLLLADGSLTRMPTATREIDVEYFYEKSRGCNTSDVPTRLSIDGAFADTEQLAPTKGLKFDVEEFHAALYEYVSPVVGKLQSSGPNAACVRSSDGVSSIYEFDLMIDMQVPCSGISYSRCLYVSAPALSLELGATYPLATRLIHRVTSYGTGIHVCEFAQKFYVNLALEDLGSIFKDGFDLLERGWRASHPSYILPGSHPHVPSPPSVRKLGKWAKRDPRITLADTMENAKYV